MLKALCLSNHGRAARSVGMDAVSEPYLSMGPSRRWEWNIWLEFPADMTSHVALVQVADRLCRDFGAVVTERYPEPHFDEGKEYWWLRVGSTTLMLMRKPPDCPVGLSVTDGDIGLLVRIGQAWGVTRFVGWRWRLWWIWRRLFVGRSE